MTVSRGATPACPPPPPRPLTERRSNKRVRPPLSLSGFLDCIRARDAPRSRTSRPARHPCGHDDPPWRSPRCSLSNCCKSSSSDHPAALFHPSVSLSKCRAGSVCPPARSRFPLAPSAPSAYSDCFSRCAAPPGCLQSLRPWRSSTGPGRSDLAHSPRPARWCLDKPAKRAFPLPRRQPASGSAGLRRPTRPGSRHRLVPGW